MAVLATICGFVFFTTRLDKSLPVSLGNRYAIGKIKEELDDLLVKEDCCSYSKDFEEFFIVWICILFLKIQDIKMRMVYHGILNSTLDRKPRLRMEFLL